LHVVVLCIFRSGPSGFPSPTVPEAEANPNCLQSLSITQTRTCFWAESLRRGGGAKATRQLTLPHGNTSKMSSLLFARDIMGWDVYRVVENQCFFEKSNKPLVFFGLNQVFYGLNHIYLLSTNKTFLFRKLFKPIVKTRKHCTIFHRTVHKDAN
jgi:hypothetical protein